MSKQGHNYFNFHLLKKTLHLQIVEQTFQLAATLNICLKSRSRPPGKKKKSSDLLFMEAKPKAVIIHDSKEMSQYELSRLTAQTMKLKKQNKPKFTGGIFNLRLSVFIVVLHFPKRTC